MPSKVVVVSGQIWSQRGVHIFGVRAFSDPLGGPDPQHFNGLVIQFPAIVVPHRTILPDHTI